MRNCLVRLRRDWNCHLNSASSDADDAMMRK